MSSMTNSVSRSAGLAGLHLEEDVEDIEGLFLAVAEHGSRSPRSTPVDSPPSSNSKTSLSMRLLTEHDTVLVFGAETEWYEEPVVEDLDDLLPLGTLRGGLLLDLLPAGLGVLEALHHALVTVFMRLEVGLPDAPARIESTFANSGSSSSLLGDEVEESASVRVFLESLLDCVHLLAEASSSVMRFFSSAISSFRSAWFVTSLRTLRPRAGAGSASPRRTRCRPGSLSRSSAL